MNLDELSAIRFRDTITFPEADIKLSIQASSYHYCSPRLDMEDLSAYSHVEVGIIDTNTGNFILPSDSRIDLPALDTYFHGEVGAYVPYESALLIKKRLESIVTIVCTVVNELTY